MKKYFNQIILALCLLSVSGCATGYTLVKANVIHPLDPDPDVKEPVKPEYLFLLPLAIPVDIAFSPVELIFFLTVPKG